jgi:hypothetical protein
MTEKDILIFLFFIFFWWDLEMFVAKHKKRSGVEVKSIPETKR